MTTSNGSSGKDISVGNQGTQGRRASTGFSGGNWHSKVQGGVSGGNRGNGSVRSRK